MFSLPIKIRYFNLDLTHTSRSLFFDVRRRVRVSLPSIFKLLIAAPAIRESNFHLSYSIAPRTNDYIIRGGCVVRAPTQRRINLMRNPVTKIHNPYTGCTTYFSKREMKGFASLSLSLSLCMCVCVSLIIFDREVRTIHVKNKIDKYYAFQRHTTTRITKRIPCDKCKH